MPEKNQSQVKNEQQQRSAARPLTTISPEVAKAIAKAFGNRKTSSSASEVLGQQQVAEPVQSAQPSLPGVGTSLPSPAKVIMGSQPLKVVFAGGGTGGHLYPALAVAEVLRQNGVQTLFFDSYRGVGREIVGRLGYTLKNIHAQGLSGNIFNKLMAVGKTGLGFLESLYHLLIFKPSNVVASGG